MNRLLNIKHLKALINSVSYVELKTFPLHQIQLPSKQNPSSKINTDYHKLSYKTKILSLEHNKILVQRM